MRGGHISGSPFGGYRFPHFRKADDLKLLTKADFILRQRHSSTTNPSTLNSAAILTTNTNNTTNNNISSTSTSGPATEEELSALTRDYDAYIQDCRDKFFTTHKKDGWLLDLYDPTTLGELWERRAALARARAASLHEAHAAGALDALTLDASEFVPTTTEDGTHEGAVWCCLEGVAPDAPHKVRPPCPPYTVIIGAVPPSWTRKEIVETLKKLPGCAELALSQPSRANYGRDCRATFNTKEDAVSARAIIADMKICDTHLQPGDVMKPMQNSEYPQPVKMAHPAFSDERVMARDLEKLLKMCEFFDSEMGIPKNTAVETFSAEAEGGKSWDSLTLQQKVDRLVIYLRLTHNVCYYCAREFFDEDEMHMICGRIHLRSNDTSAVVPGGDNGGEGVKKDDVILMPQARAMMNEIDKFIRARKEVNIPEVTGKHIREEKIAKFCEENSKVINGGIVSCLLCSKKFKGREFVNNHIVAKHQDHVALAIKKEMEDLLKKNYMCDPHRIAPEADSSAAPVPLRPYKDLDSIDDTEAVNIYKSMFAEEEEEEEEEEGRNENEVDMDDRKKPAEDDEMNGGGNDDNDDEMK